MANQYRSVLASGGAGTGGDAVAANVLAGKTFTNDNGFDTGTMVNNGAVSQTLNGGESYTIPEGYHNGSGVITAAAGYQYAHGTANASSSGQATIDTQVNFKILFTIQSGGIVCVYDRDSDTFERAGSAGTLPNSDPNSINSVGTTTFTYGRASAGQESVKWYAFY